MNVFPVVPSLPHAASCICKRIRIPGIYVFFLQLFQPRLFRSCMIHDTASASNMNTRNAHPAGAGSSLSVGQLELLIYIERIGAGLSMVAITLTILSFILFKSLRNTPNLFLVLASVANAGASVASMIGYDGLQHGQNSSLCQAQAFIFQLFMQADPWWSCAMAINVFLVFFFNVKPSKFRKYVWVYCLVCFGGPTATAIGLVLTHDAQRGPVYGDADLWCWISPNWSLVRLYAYYIPIWICILSSIVIYIAVRYLVFRHRNQLRIVTGGRLDETKALVPASATSDFDHEITPRGFDSHHDVYGTAVTEVRVTTDTYKDDFYDGFLPLPSTAHIRRQESQEPLWARRQYKRVHENAKPMEMHQFETTCSSNGRPPSSLRTWFQRTKESASSKLKRLDPVKMAYLRTSFIFGFAVLITWIPSSVNRLYTEASHGKVNYQLSIASGCVLPLQGVWNAIIYFTTSWQVFLHEVDRFKARIWGREPESCKSTPRSVTRMGISP